MVFSPFLISDPSGKFQDSHPKPILPILLEWWESAHETKRFIVSYIFKLDDLRECVVPAHSAANTTSSSLGRAVVFLSHLNGSSSCSQRLFGVPSSIPLCDAKGDLG